MTPLMWMKALAFVAFTLLSFFFFFFFVRDLFIVVRSIRRIHKPCSHLVDPCNVTCLLPKPFLQIGIYRIGHTLTLLLLSVLFGYGTTLVYDYTPIMTMIFSEVQGLDTSDCLSLPREVWTHMVDCQ